MSSRPDPAAAAAGAGAGSPPAVDASMRLLRNVMEQPLDPAYARAAQLRATGARPATAAVLLTVLIAVLCGWVLVRGVAELRRPQPGAVAGRTAIEREIGRRTAAADARQREIQRLGTEIAAAQQAQLRSTGDTVLADRAQQLGLLTGELPVSGPGLEFSLQSARPTTDSGDIVDPRADSPGENGRVLDRDLQVVVNGLWAAGAEAVAINGRRLTTLSAIRSAGEAILVDFRPLLPPYRIQAIGDPAGMQSQFNSQLAGMYVQSLRDNYGVSVSVTTVPDLRLPAAGTFQLRRAGPAPTPTPTPAVGRDAPPSGGSAQPAPQETTSPSEVHP